MGVFLGLHVRRRFELGLELDHGHPCPLLVAGAFEGCRGLAVSVLVQPIQGRAALGPDAGRRIERLGSRSQDSRSFWPTPLCAAIDGFSLHAEVHVAAHDRERLEHLSRYVARPAIATERLSLSDDVHVVYALRSPWRDGTTHFVFDPLSSAAIAFGVARGFGATLRRSCAPSVRKALRRAHATRLLDRRLAL